MSRSGLKFAKFSKQQKLTIFVGERGPERGLELVRDLDDFSVLEDFTDDG